MKKHLPQFWRAATVAVTCAILYLSLAPRPPSVGLGWDKANHAAAMAAITFLAYLALRPASRAVVFAAGYALLLGILIEVLQGLCTVTRTAEWGDLGADVIGTALATVLVVSAKLTKGRLS